MCGLFSFLIITPAFAKNTQRPIIQVSCDCRVYNNSGELIHANSFLGSPVPVTTPYFEVAGYSHLKSSFELKNCVENSSGQLPMACAGAAVTAKTFAEKKCGEIAQKHNPDIMDGFKNGHLIQGSCQLSLIKEMPRQSTTQALFNLLSGQ